MAEEITTYWTDSHSAIEFHMVRDKAPKAILYSKVYPAGKATDEWDYVKVGFGLATNYEKVDFSTFKKAVESYKN